MPVHKAHARPNPDNNDTRPYWRRAHHDWRFWIAMVLMVAAISTYIATQSLSLRPEGTRVAPTPAAVAP